MHSLQISSKMNLTMDEVVLTRIQTPSCPRIFMIDVCTSPRGPPPNKAWRTNMWLWSPIGPLFPWFRGGSEGGDPWQISFPLFWHRCVWLLTSRGASSGHLFGIWPWFLIWAVIDSIFIAVALAVTYSMSTLFSSLEAVVLVSSVVSFVFIEVSFWTGSSVAASFKVWCAGMFSLPIASNRVKQ